MRVKRNRVVSIHYRLRLDTGEEVDTSRRRGPLTFLVGHGEIIPGLERELINMEVGDKKKVRVEAKDGYGLVNEALVQSIDRDDIPNNIDLAVGAVLRGQSESGNIVEGLITALGENNVIIDFNHPLAGEALNFETEIIEIREATADEISHRHVH
jgi:FKBP-type peptidyl-prolyl cis-trans isomerase SlyD